jgi:hypothetical protein
LTWPYMLGKFKDTNHFHVMHRYENNVACRTAHRSW